MRYLCLIYHDEQRLATLPAQQYDALIREICDYDEELRQRGHCLGANMLDDTRTATTIRVRQGRVLISDGPCAETEEQLRGYALIEARDLNEAIRVVARMPPARLGSIEVRPVKAL